MIGAIRSVLDALSTGIPGIIVAGLAVVFMVLALIREDSGMMIIAGLMIVPLTYTSGAWAGWLLVVRLLPLLVFISAYFISASEMIIAWVVPAPSFAYVAYHVFTLLIDSYQNT